MSLTTTEVAVHSPPSLLSTRWAAHLPTRKEITTATRVLSIHGQWDAPNDNNPDQGDVVEPSIDDEGVIAAASLIGRDASAHTTNIAGTMPNTRTGSTPSNIVVMLDFHLGDNFNLHF